MPIHNETQYCGKMLRSVFLAAVKHAEGAIARTLAARHPQSTTIVAGIRTRADRLRRDCAVTVVYTRHRGCSGLASLGGGWCRIRVPKGSVHLARLAWLVQHEIYHLFGVRHRDMPHAVNHWSSAGIAAAREHYSHLIDRYGDVVHETPEPAKTVVTAEQKQASRLASIEERIARWESKARRAENALKKLRRQKRYYESRLTVTARAPR